MNYSQFLLTKLYTDSFPMEFKECHEADLDPDMEYSEEDDYEIPFQCVRDLQNFSFLRTFSAEVLQFKSSGERFILISFTDEESDDYKKLPMRWGCYRLFYERKYGVALALGATSSIQNHDQTL